jgi:hypothetical protein
MDTTKSIVVLCFATAVIVIVDAQVVPSSWPQVSPYNNKVSESIRCSIFCLIFIDFLIFFFLQQLDPMLFPRSNLPDGPFEVRKSIIDSISV